MLSASHRTHRAFQSERRAAVPLSGKAPLPAELLSRKLAVPGEGGGGESAVVRGPVPHGESVHHPGAREGGHGSIGQVCEGGPPPCGGSLSSQSCLRQTGASRRGTKGNAGLPGTQAAREEDLRPAPGPETQLNAERQPAAVRPKQDLGARQSNVRFEVPATVFRPCRVLPEYKPVFRFDLLTLVRSSRNAYWEPRRASG